jgi:GNAT superfamily N-acetyltransferase
VAYTIRAASEADAEATGMTLVAAANAAWGWFLGEERIAAANRDRRHPADLVAVDSQGVFGFVAWDADTGEITRLYVHPRGQAQGAGRDLLAHAVTATGDAGRREAWLYTEQRGHDTRRFYEAQGWVRSGPPRSRDWHGTSLAELRYAKRAGPQAQKGDGEAAPRRRSWTRNREAQQKGPLLRASAVQRVTGATGLEPATSGVTGRGSL